MNGDGALELKPASGVGAPQLAGLDHCELQEAAGAAGALGAQLCPDAHHVRELALRFDHVLRQHRLDAALRAACYTAQGRKQAAAEH